MLPYYSQPSYFQKGNGSMTVDLGPLRAHVFEIDTPDIEKLSNPKNVMQQKF